jgi:hypothetical protein
MIQRGNNFFAKMSDNYVAFAIPANRVRQFLDRAEVK